MEAASWRGRITSATVNVITHDVVVGPAAAISRQLAAAVLLQTDVFGIIIREIRGKSDQPLLIRLG